MSSEKVISAEKHEAKLLIWRLVWRITIIYFYPEPSRTNKELTCHLPHFPISCAPLLVGVATHCDGATGWLGETAWQTSGWRSNSNLGHLLTPATHPCGTPEGRIHGPGGKKYISKSPLWDLRPRGATPASYSSWLRALGHCWVLITSLSPATLMIDAVDLWRVWKSDFSTRKEGTQKCAHERWVVVD